MDVKTAYVMVIIPGFIGRGLDYLLPLCKGSDGLWQQRAETFRHIMAIKGREN